MADQNVTKRIKNVLLDLNLNCIGLKLKDISTRTYIKILLRHLYGLIRSPKSHPRHKRRAQIILLSLVFTSITFLSGSSYIAFQLVTRCYSFYKYTWLGNESIKKKRGYLKRTRSQLQLETGARIMYIARDISNINNNNNSNDYEYENSKINNINNGDNSNLLLRKNKFMEGSIQSILADSTNNGTVNNNNEKNNRKVKKIFIPPKDNDIIEHDKFLFKNIDSQKYKISNIFYSKFLNQMNILSKILIPSVFDKNSILLTFQIFFLVMRTWLSLFVARLDGQIVRDIISGKSKKFLIDLVIWFLIALPASYTNSAIKFLQRKLSLNFRVKLTRYVHDMYLDKRLAFYKLIFDSKANSSVIKNIDNSITNDITRFCDATCSVFANIAKPVIDLIFFSFYLRDNLGSFGVVGIFVNYFITGYILRSYTPPLGKLTSASSAADGDYYNYHLNMINNNEEISFYQGTQVERAKVNELYETLMDRMLIVSKRKFNYNMIEDYILKYTWSGLGYVFASIPIVLTTLVSGENIEQNNMKDFIVNKRLMLSLADAGSRLMHSIKDISQLTGYTNRIFTLLSALHRVHSENFSYGAVENFKQMVTSENITDIDSKLIVKKENEDIISGTVQRNFNGIRFENIDVIIPSARGKNGHKLIKRLTFQIPEYIDPISSKVPSLKDLSSINDMTIPLIGNSGSSLLVLGPNSCGKSSLQRIIAEIWPIYNKYGLLSKPDMDSLFCVPQRPYFTRGGTLRDQIIYPMSSDDFFDRGYKDKVLVWALTEVRLDYLLKRDRGWRYLDAVVDWKDVLSGGEKQRMNFARIMFHKPRFIVLDEATNAISVDMEDYLFNMLKKYRFNFITMSQRPSLIKYHDILLEISDKDGGWNLQTLGTDEAITSIDNEIEQLEKQLDKVKEWRIERDEIQQKLAII